MESGVIRALKLDKGYGFLRAGGNDLFFHMTACITNFFDLKPGDSVTFETEEGPKGIRAINVEKIEKAA